MGKGGEMPPKLFKRLAPTPKPAAPPPSPLRAWLPLDPKYGIYAATWALSKATGAGSHLLATLAWATALRYAVNHAFVALSKADAFAEPRRIHRKNPPAAQLERELDWDGPVILSPLAFVVVDLATPWLRADRVAAFDGRCVFALFAAHYLAVEPVYYAFHVWLHREWAYKRSHGCLLYTSPSPRDKRQSRMPSSA